MQEKAMRYAISIHNFRMKVRLDADFKEETGSRKGFNSQAFVAQFDFRWRRLTQFQELGLHCSLFLHAPPAPPGREGQQCQEAGI